MTKRCSSASASAICGRCPRNASELGATMTTQTAIQPVTNGSFSVLWTLVTRSVGLTAGLAIALLIMAALISTVTL